MTLSRTAFENIMAKGEVADNQDFLIFPQWFPNPQKKPLVKPQHTTSKLLQQPSQ